MTSQTHADPARLTWTFGDRLRKIRTALGLNQAELADILGESKSTIGAWEIARNEPRNVVALSKRIQLATGVPALWLLGLTDDPRPGDPDGGGGSSVRHEGLEPPTRWLSVSPSQGRVLAAVA